jgi:hypothetical protein
MLNVSLGITVRPCLICIFLAFGIGQTDIYAIVQRWGTIADASKLACSHDQITSARK